MRRERLILTLTLAIHLNISAGEHTDIHDNTCKNEDFNILFPFSFLCSVLRNLLLFVLNQSSEQGCWFSMTRSVRCLFLLARDLLADSLLHTGAHQSVKELNSKFKILQVVHIPAAVW